MARSAAQLRAIFAALRGMKGSTLSKARYGKKMGIMKLGPKAGYMSGLSDNRGARRLETSSSIGGYGGNNSPIRLLGLKRAKRSKAHVFGDYGSTVDRYGYYKPGFRARKKGK